MKRIYLFLLLPFSLVVLALYNRTDNTANRFGETKEIISFRKIVHELLRSSGDSTSLILPLERIAENEYRLMPENQFSVNPDSFINIVNSVSKNHFKESFTANVVRKNDNEIAYAFLWPVSENTDSPSCTGRNLPKDSYYFSFIFQPQKTIPWNWLLYAAGMLLLAAGITAWRHKKKIVAEMDATVIKNSNEQKNKNAGTINVGKFIFDPLQQYIELNAEKITLTGKETKLLSIFAGAINSIVDRDVLQKEVWENEGVIVTRSLDMFISKLRKKLAADPSIKIVNVHGKGYKLMVSDEIYS